MTTLLAIDTAADICSVAISQKSTTRLHKSADVRRHAAEVLPMVQALLDESDLTLAEIDAIVMVSGPGSFTGLRIGTAVAQGLSFGADIPIIRISALAMLARAGFLASGERSGTASVFFACMHAREDEFYYARYLDDGVSIPEALKEDHISDAASILASLAPHHGESHSRFGVGTGWLQSALQRSGEGADAIKLLTRVESDASTLCELGAAAFAAGHTVSADEALPVYLKDDMAYRKS